MDFAGTTHNDKANLSVKPLRTFFLVALTLFTILPTDSFAAFYYVDQNHPNANDANPGTSETAPWRTLHRAMQASVLAGDTVFVKNGTYSDSSPAISGDITPKFNPANSGTPAAPIAFRAYAPPSGPRHTPVVSRNLTGQDGVNSPVIGSEGRDYIIWDGFTLASGTDVRVDSATGVVLENLLIDKGATPSTGGIGNYDGIHLQLATNTIVRYNTIRNVYYVNDTHQNAACVKLYDAHNTSIYNNDFSRCNTGIYDKENGVGNVYERNYLHDIGGDAFLFNGFTATSRCGVCPVQNNTIRYNVVENVRTGVTFSLSDSSRDGNMTVYNNTFYNTALGIGMTSALPGMGFYNNIITLSAPATDGNHAHVFVRNATVPDDLLSSYSNFSAPAAPYVGFSVNWSIESLLQWQGRGLDLNSRTDNPLFSGSLSGTPPPTAFRLQSVSPLINAGRVGGTPTGSPVNMGAYIADSDIVGPILVVQPPSAPAGLVSR